MTTLDPSRSGMSWAVRPSFVEYVARTGGDITVHAPAVMHEQGFGWPATTATAPAGSPTALRVELAGAVSFFAHGGMLDITLGGLVATVDDGVLRLHAITSDGSEVTVVEGPCAPTTAVDGVEAWVAHPALHPDAVDWFGGNYPAGTGFAPLLLTVSAPR